MPFYDYRCDNCRRKSRLFYTFAEYDQARPICPHCQSDQMRRRIGRIAIAKSEDARLDAMADDSALAGLDEEDPRSLGRFMRKMSDEMGEDMGEEFDEVVGRLESGESPESIEASMPELGESGGSFGGGDDDFM
jgi:putative FmdB family regulatory protein